jgi:hypothetical protein
MYGLSTKEGCVVMLGRFIAKWLRGVFTKETPRLNPGHLLKAEGLFMSKVKQPQLQQNEMVVIGPAVDLHQWLSDQHRQQFWVAEDTNEMVEFVMGPAVDLDFIPCPICYKAGRAYNLLTRADEAASCKVCGWHEGNMYDA